MCVYINVVAGSIAAREDLSPLTSDMEQQDLEFVLMGLDLALVLSALPFGMVVHMLCHCTLEVCTLLFDFTGAYSEEADLSLRRYFDFEKKFLWGGFRNKFPLCRNFLCQLLAPKTVAASQITDSET